MTDLNQMRLEPELESARMLLNAIAERGVTLSQAIEEAKAEVKAAELKLSQLESLRALKSEVPLPRKTRADKGKPRAKTNGVEPNPEVPDQTEAEATP